ncbi:MAG: hypothetical protein Q9163_003715 [Psora crenata]
MASRKQKDCIVPGMGLPLQWPNAKYMNFTDTLLGSTLDGSEDPHFCYTVREKKMIAWISELTDMEGWEEKIWDNNSVFEWKSAKVITGGDVTRSMADWCVEEARYYLQDCIRTGIVPAVDGGVIKSDHCIEATLRRDIQEAISSLKKTRSVQRHKTPHQVDDVVDPFLYPFCWGKTRVVKSERISREDCISRCGDGLTQPMPPEEDCGQPWFVKYRNDMAWSRRYQWLPFDVTFGTDGEGPSQIISTINNVHPTTQSAIYSVSERLIDKLIPLFNRTLVDIKAPGYQGQRIHLVDYARGSSLIDRDPGPFRPPEQRGNNNGYLGENNRYQTSIFVDLKKEFWNIGLQFVLHVREIHLTPDEPVFKSDKWHVQGQTNERICATAAFVSSISNVSTNGSPTFSFRRRVNTEEAIAAKGEVNTPPFLPEIYNARHGDPTVQTLGDVHLRDGRVIVWPNVFQTRLNSFKLDDPSRPGHCKVVFLHLVDPNRRILSSSSVPCQRHDWWAEAVRGNCAKMWRLPKEIFGEIIGLVDEYPIAAEEAERIRQDFIHEREAFHEKHTKALESFEEWDFWGEPGVEDNSHDSPDDSVSEE